MLTGNEAAIFCDPRRATVIQEMIEQDCIRLYDKHNHNKSELKAAIELYEQFIHTEINSLFEACNRFEEILPQHVQNFEEFTAEMDVCGMQPPLAKRKRTTDMYVIYITVQEWLLQGPRSQQFYTMVDIGSFQFQQNQILPNNLVADGDHVTRTKSTDSFGKRGHLTKIGEPVDRIIVFRNHQPIRCAAGILDSIRQTRANLNQRNAMYVKGIPTKCAHLVLPKIFYGLYITVSYTSNTLTRVHISLKTPAYSFTGEGSTLIGAKNLAAQRALRKLCSIKSEGVLVNTVTDGPSFADEIEQMVTMLCSKFPCFVEMKQNRRNVISAIIQTSDDDSKSAKVIVLASGTKGIDAENMYREGTVHDTHAEVVARRSLMVYFYDQLKMLCDESSQGEVARCHQPIFRDIHFISSAEIVTQSIFTRQSSDPDARYKLKDGIRFRLFLSRAPCGDATAYYCKNSSKIGKLRVKVEKKAGYLLVDNIKGETQLSGAHHEGAVLYTASCSDKIARWNVVGVRGALLSRIIEPIYLESIVMTQYRLYKRSDFVRAFYGRIEGSVSGLPSTYHHRKFRIAIASVEYNRDTQAAETSPYSLNWVICDTAPEKITSRTGLVSSYTLSDSSRLSKMELMKRFVDVMKNLPHLPANTPFDAAQTYDKMKEDAIDYNTAKEACIEAFRSKSLGNWAKVQKPSEIDKFTL